MGRLNPGTAVIRDWTKDWEPVMETEKELLKGGGEPEQDGVKTNFLRRK